MNKLKETKEAVQHEYKLLAKQWVNSKTCNKLKELSENYNHLKAHYHVNKFNDLYVVSSLDIDDFLSKGIPEDLREDHEFLGHLGDRIEKSTGLNIIAPEQGHYISFLVSSPIFYNGNYDSYENSYCFYAPFYTSEIAVVYPQEYDTTENAYKHGVKKMKKHLQGINVGLVVKIDDYGIPSVDKKLTEYLNKLETKEFSKGGK